MLAPYASYPAGFKLPDRTRNILVSVGPMGKHALLETCVRLQRLGYNLYATEGTKRHLDETGQMEGASCARALVTHCPHARVCRSE